MTRAKATDEQYMTRAINLAAKGLGRVSPNPMVGCVIVKDDTIIGEGYHQQYGSAHAEVNAVNSVSDLGLLKGATAYVTLEPCSHYGKTPPCADLLIEKGLARVVIAHEDTHHLVDGAGIKKLRKAGVDVEIGLLRDEYAHLNRRFFSAIRNRRPYIILKWAETVDGFIARKNFESKWISNAYARQLVHKWRAEEDAILVGSGTATHDNPALTVRDWTGQHPLRIVIDRSLKLPSSLQLFDQKVPTVVVNTQVEKEEDNITWMKVSPDHMEDEMLNRLYDRSVRSVFIEGGAQTKQRFIDAQLWDEARIFKSNTKFDEGIPAPILHGNLSAQMDVMGDELSIYHR